MLCVLFMIAQQLTIKFNLYLADAFILGTVHSRSIFYQYVR